MITLHLGSDTDDVARAAALLRAGHCVAFPTETVYGLGADATDPAAVVRIYEAKQRPRFNPLIAHVSDAGAAAREGVFDAAARALAEAFWPGPLTLVVPCAPGGSVCDIARAGLDSIALRVPAHPVARALLQAAARPVVAPSANRSGRVSPTRAEHVAADLDGRIAAIVDAGETRVGIESTIVACVGGNPVLLRPGGVPRDAVEAVLGRPLAQPTIGEAGDAASDAPRAPGLLASHYAPRARVRLDAREIRPGEAALLFGEPRPEGLANALIVRDLSPGGDLGQAAQALFASLRALDASGAHTIAVAPIPRDGLGEAIADRLARAAAPR